MTDRFAGPAPRQVVVITGAGQGIGRAIALRLADDGFNVVVADHQAAQAHAVANEVDNRGRAGLALTVDVTRATDRQHLFDATLAHFGRLDVLVNNAATLRAALPRDVTEEHWDTLMDVNAKAVYFCSQVGPEVAKLPPAAICTKVLSSLGTT